MNPHLCRIALRPRDPAEVFDLSFRVIRDAWQPIARLSAIVLVPLAVLGGALCWYTSGDPGVLALPFVAAPIVQAPYTVLVGRLMFAPDVRVRAVLLDTFLCAPALIATWFASLAVWTLAAATCGIALPFGEAAILYTSETALLEKVGLSRGLRRSWRLASSHVGIAFVGASSWAVLTAWGGLVGEFAWQGLLDTVLQLGTPFGALGEGRVTPGLLAGLLCAQPLHAVYRLLLYVDVRTRNEGWDLQVALRAAGMQP